jgi:hypothetical protein
LASVIAGLEGADVVVLVKLGPGYVLSVLIVHVLYGVGELVILANGGTADGSTFRIVP